MDLFAWEVWVFFCTVFARIRRLHNNCAENIKILAREIPYVRQVLSEDFLLRRDGGLEARVRLDAVPEGAVHLES